MTSHLARRSVLSGALAATALALAPRASAAGRQQILHVDPRGRGDHTTVQAAVSAVPSDGWTIVLAPGVYRETVVIPLTATNLTLRGTTRDPRDTVIVYDNAAGTAKPSGGTYGTTGSATTTVQADGFTAHDLTFANDWLRADHPDITSGTQAVAIKVQGDRSSFLNCRFLGHQDTLYADSMGLGIFARQYFRDCYVEGDVDFVFGRATAVYEHCHFRTLDRTDLAAAPYGFVFAPSTAVANPRGYLVLNSHVTSGAPAAHYKLARPWVPGSDTTARPMLTVRESVFGPGIDSDAPYTNMQDIYPWQAQRFAEYRNTGPGARINVPENRPQLTDAEAQVQTRSAYLGDWTPWKRC
ncbi:pectinesterase family protein [Streptomyces sp. NPDC058231]|uniref:pectinesterase family protein n=1 Tax=Streptomyces sp. NPDC058231 TaxID=3346392 RepID=UPI0036EE335C